MSDANIISMVAKLRGDGWSVAVHNDYRLNGQPHTFWLFTHANGRWIKGEGKTDADAVTQAAIAADEVTRMAKSVKDLLTRFERSPARTMVSEDYATGYREAIEYVLDTVALDDSTT
jgi:hypothetical protein